MHVSDRQAQSLLQALYHTASKDRSDIIANAASRLAVRFEHITGKGFDLSVIEQRLIQYAVQSKPENGVQISRRKTYKRRTPVV